MSEHPDAGRAIQLPAGSGDVPIIPITLSRNVPAGAIVRLHSDGLMMISNFTVDHVRVAGGSTFTELHRYSREEQVQNWNWYTRTKPMITFQTTNPLDAGTVLEVVPREGAGIAVAGLGWNLYLSELTDANADSGTSLAEPVYVEFVAAERTSLQAFLKPDGSLIKVLVDANDNPVTSKRVAEAVGRVDAEGRVSVDWETEVGTFAAVSNATPGVVINAPANARPSDTEPADPGPSGDARASDAASGDVRANGTELADSGSHPPASETTPVWFGEFHWHTDFSGDGQRSLSDALTSARDELGLDFAGPADHMGASGQYSREGTPEMQAETCSRFDEPGRFVTMPGAEMSGRYGHANYYARSWDAFLKTIKRFPERLQPEFRAHPFSYPLSEFAAIPDVGDGLVVPHHANMDSWVSEGVVREDGLPYWCAMHWPIPANRDAVRLVEIVQHRGCFEDEIPDERWGIHFGGLGGSARTALARGYRVGFIAGTDNHTGWPTRSMGQSGYAGVTAVVCDRLETDAIFTALYERRCYATSGARIIANASLNGHPIGSEIPLAPGAAREFEVSIHGTAPITDVEIVHLGYVLHRFETHGSSLDFHATWNDERPGRPLQDAWYYIRARQADGHRVWLSPFWVDFAEPS